MLSWKGIVVELCSSGSAAVKSVTYTGTALLDLPFPVRIRRELVASGKADLHYLHPESGWVTHTIRGEQDAAAIIDLFRLNYHRPWLQRAN